MTQKILIVDDCPSARDQIQELFTSIGYTQFDHAPNGLEAIKKAEHADIISLDIVMPHMDGLECYAQLQAQWPNQKKILFISFLAREESFKQAFFDQVPGALLFAKYPTAEKLKATLNPEDSVTNTEHLSHIDSVQAV
jgi:two-component system, chemotaxis family, chemotaxis protein CheY